MDRADRLPAADPALGGMPGLEPNHNRPSFRKAFVAFRNPYFRRHWASTIASFSGMQMQMVALGILGWQLSGSYAVVGVLQASFAIPLAVLSLPAGALADRVEKRRLVATSQGLLGLLAAATAVLIQTDLITITLLFLAGLVQGSLFSANGPSRMALLTEVVDRRELTAAISMQNIAMNSTRVLGPATAGVLIALVSIEGVYYATAALYGFSVLSILTVPRSSTHLGRARTALQSDISAGLGYVFRDSTLRSLMLSGFVVAFFVMPYQVMLPGFADNLGQAEMFSAMVAVSGLGGILGSLGVAGISEHPRKPFVQFLVGLTCGTALMGLGLLAGPFGMAGAFAALAVVGATSTGYLTLNQTMLMMHGDPAYRGRVMSMGMLTFGAMPLMALPLGLLADGIGGRGAFVAQGLITATAILVLGLANRRHTFREQHAPQEDSVRPRA